VFSFGTSLYANSKYGIYSSHVLGFDLDTREKMKTMGELATENEKQAKQEQKLYYDRKARDRKLEVGQKVLILQKKFTEHNNIQLSCINNVYFY
jgi:hypothetical protein